MQRTSEMRLLKLAEPFQILLNSLKECVNLKGEGVHGSNILDRYYVMANLATSR